MAHRRPEPEGFQEDLQLLIELEARRAALDLQIDEVFLRITVDKQGPTATIAEQLDTTAPAVSSRRNSALRRRRMREQGSTHVSRAA
jgi:hypothetical protein